MKIEISGATAIMLIARKAAQRFGTDKEGDQDGVFNSACFSNAASEILGMSGLTLDGAIVELILDGRRGINNLDNGHWRIATVQP